MLKSQGSPPPGRLLAVAGTTHTRCPPSWMSADLVGCWNALPTSRAMTLTCGISSSGLHTVHIRDHERTPHLMSPAHAVRRYLSMRAEIEAPGGIRSTVTPAEYETFIWFPGGAVHHSSVFPVPFVVCCESLYWVLFSGCCCCCCCIVAPLIYTT